MRIVYFAKEPQRNSNDEEGAIEHAFQVLGHEVIRVSEKYIYKADRRIPKGAIDLILIHKPDPHNAVLGLKQLEGIAPRACWYFDLVDSSLTNAGKDPLLIRRDHGRAAWMKKVLPNLEYAFLTDGEWIRATGRPLIESGKLPASLRLHWLPQGCDSRIAGIAQEIDKTISVLFVGDPKGGTIRQHWVDHLERILGSKFVVVRSGCHGEELKRLVASAYITVAPNAPVADYYFSNRVFLLLGFGAFLLHPFSRGLKLLIPGIAPFLYQSMDYQDLYQSILTYRENPAFCEMKTLELHQEVKANHSYVVRCSRLLETIKQIGE